MPLLIWYRSANFHSIEFVVRPSLKPLVLKLEGHRNLDQIVQIKNTSTNNKDWIPNRSTWKMAVVSPAKLHYSKFIKRFTWPNLLPNNHPMPQVYYLKQDRRYCSGGCSKTLMPGAYLDEKWFTQQNHFLHRPDANEKQQLVFIFHHDQCVPAVQCHCKKVHRRASRSIVFSYKTTRWHLHQNPGSGLKKLSEAITNEFGALSIDTLLKKNWKDWSIARFFPYHYR